MAGLSDRGVARCFAQNLPPKVVDAVLRGRPRNLPAFGGRRRSWGSGSMRAMVKIDKIMPAASACLEAVAKQAREQYAQAC